MKTKRSYSRPSAFEIFFLAWMALFLGGLAAVCHLVLKPVPVVHKASPDPRGVEIGFTEGEKNPELGRAWLQKLQAFREARSVRVSEEELNTAVSHPMERPKSLDETGASGEEMEIIPGVVNFRIAGGELQIAIPVKLSQKGPVVIVQALGSFVQTPRGFRFEPRLFYVGSCPIHRIPFAAGIMLKRLENSQSIPEDLKENWAKLSEVKISEDRLCLNF